MENNQSGDKVEILTNQDYLDRIIKGLISISKWEEANNQLLQDILFQLKLSNDSFEEI